MKPSNPRQQRLGIKQTHHQIGARPSVMEVTRSEIQPMPRWLATSGVRWSSGGTVGKGALLTSVAISELLSPRHVRCLDRLQPANLRHFHFQKDCDFAPRIL